MNPVWMGPDFLPSLFSPQFNSVLDAYFHPMLASSNIPWLSGLAQGDLWRFVAIATIVTELLLTILLLVAPGPWLNALLFPFGVILHASMEASGLQIGHFSYFMVIFYLLLLPPRLVSVLQVVMARLDVIVNRSENLYRELHPHSFFAPLDVMLASICWTLGHYLIWTRMNFDRPALFFALLAFDIVIAISGARAGIYRVLACFKAQSKATQPVKRKLNSSSCRRMLGSSLVFLLCCGTLVAFEASTQQYVKFHQTGSQDALKMSNPSLGTVARVQWSNCSTLLRPQSQL